MNIFIKKIFVITLLNAMAFASITGVAYKDYNGDGIQQSGEPGIADITVNVYTTDGTSDKKIAEVQTDSDGKYTLNISSSDFPVRLEFEIPSDKCLLDKTKDFAGSSGDIYGTSVQIVKKDGEIHNFALSYPYDVAGDDNPETFAPVAIAGDPLANGTTASTVSILKFKYKNIKIAENSGRLLEENSTAFNRTEDETGPAWIELTKQEQTGSIYGLAYSRQAGKLFAAAFLKRHTGFGPLGSGGIYLVDPNPSNNKNVEFLNLDEIGIATQGSGKYQAVVINGNDDNNSNDFVEFLTVIGSNSDRGLNKNKESASNDPMAYGQVGKLSLGDIDISEDGRFLYVVNLYDRKLYQIDLTDPKNPVAPTLKNKKDKVKEFVIPNTCKYSNKAGEYRPFGLKVLRGKAYVGIVCSGQDSYGNIVADSTSDMIATVSILDIAKGTWRNDIEWKLDYRDNDGSNKPWKPWTNQWKSLEEYPTPLIGDIELDNKGNLLVGLIDLFGNQTGYGDYGLTLKKLFATAPEGDLIKIERTYKETNAVCQYFPNLKPEFYDDNLIHSESSMGSLAGHHTSYEDTVLSTFIDPIIFKVKNNNSDGYKPYSVGVHLYNNITGDRVNGDIGYEIAYNSLTHFGKANAIGDLETVEAIPSIEIGNLIWRDSDGDGIQDSNEAGIENVVVQLLNSKNEVIATTTTNSQGYYIFNSDNVNNGKGLEPNTNYIIQIDPDQFNNKGLDGTVLESMYLTKTDSTSTASNYSDSVDSDGKLQNGNAVINLTTGSEGENNHTYDMGFVKIGISLIKKADIQDVNNNGKTDKGDTIHYSFIVTNIGDTVLNDIKIVDTKVESITCDKTSLNINEITTCNADSSYIITQHDMDMGYVKNTAVVEGTSPDGNKVTDISDTGTDPQGNDINNPEDKETPDENGTKNGDPTDDPTVIDVPQSPGISLIKKAKLIDTDGDNKVSKDDLIEYTFTLKNTGDTTLADIKITDNKVGIITCKKTTLDVNESTTCKANNKYTITQNDIDKGFIKNTAVVDAKTPKGEEVTDTSDTGTDTNGNNIDNPEDKETPDENGTKNGDPTDDPTIIKTPQNPAIKIIKKAKVSDVNKNGIIDKNDTIQYSFYVTNIGDVTLHDVKIKDSKMNVKCNTNSLNPYIITLKVGETVKCIAYPEYDYTITQDDVDAGYVKNTATAEGTDPNGEKVIDISDTGTDANGNDINDPEKVETPDEDGNKNGDPTDDPTIIIIAKKPKISIIKLGEFIDGNSNGLADEGESIKYTFIVKNTGNMTLSDITVHDDKVTVTGGPITLKPGEEDSTTFKATYILTQKDLDNGEVENQAIAKGNDPDGNTTEDKSDDNSTDDGEDDPTIVDLVQNPKISLVKKAKLIDKNLNGSANLGEGIQYSFLVKNIGNVTLHNITIKDNKVDSVTCSKTTLEVNETTTCNADSNYIITQDDIDAGYVKNTAVVEGTSPDGNKKVTDISDTGTDATGKEIEKPEDNETPDENGTKNGDPTDDPTIIGVIQNPSISLIKKAKLIDLNKNRQADIDESILFTFILRNTGDTTLNNIKVTDNKIGSITCNKTTLEVNETTTCKADNEYIITQDDLNRGYIKNIATAEGTDPKGEKTTDTSDTGTDTNGNDIPNSEQVETPDENGTKNGDPTDDPTIITIPQNPKISIIKMGEFIDSNENGLADVGESIKYTFIVKNTGNMTLTNITVHDDKVNVIGDPISLNPGEEDNSTFSAIYILTKEDITAGQVINQATAQGKDPGNNLVKDKSDDNSTTEDDPTITKYINYVCIGDYIWFDKNLNGKQDEGNMYGVSGIKVYLYDNKGNLAKDKYGNEIKAVLTDKSGHYQFCNVSSQGEYYLQIEIPDSYHTTLQDVGSDKTDSDANKDGLIFISHPSKDNMNFDIGLYCDCDDWKVHPENYDEVKASFTNKLLIFFFIFVFSLGYRKREK